MTGAVTLEALMPTDPVVTTTIEIDPGLIYLAPGQTITTTSDLVEVEDDQSVVFAAEYHQDLFSGGPFGSSHIPGPARNVMTATIASPEASCQVSSPVIFEQPISVTADEGATVNLRVNADGNDMPMTYQWLREGQPLVEAPCSGRWTRTSCRSRKSRPNPKGSTRCESATRAGPSCPTPPSCSSSVTTNRPFIRWRAPPTSTMRTAQPCRTSTTSSPTGPSGSNGGPVLLASADFNGVGGVTVQDLYDFFSAWNDGCP